MNSTQQAAHDRLMASMPVTLHLRKAAEPSRSLQARRDATAKMLETKAKTPHVNAWIEPAPKQVRRNYGRGAK